MADLSKIKLNGVVYTIKDAVAQGLIDAEEARALAAEAELQEAIEEKQDIIDEDNMLAAAYVSLDPESGTKLTAEDVNSAIYELERAIETGGTGSIVSVEKQATAESGYFATYVIKQGGEAVSGPKINIPKDYLVKSASIKTVEEDDEPYEGAKVGDKYIDFVVNVKEGSATDEHIYLPVNELVDAYVADETTLHLGANNTFSIKAVSMDLVTGLSDALAAKAAQSDLQAEITRAQGAEADLEAVLADKVDEDELGALAKADSASGWTVDQTIDIDAEASVEGEVDVELGFDAIAASVSTSLVERTGEIEGEIGTIESAALARSLDESGVQISGVVAAPSITLNSQTDSITPVATLGSVAEFVEGEFVPGSWTPTPGNYNTDAMKMHIASGAEISGDVDAETLIIENAATAAAVATAVYVASSKASDSFTANELPTFGTAKSFLTSSTTASATAPTFTGDKFNINLTAGTTSFSGSATISVSEVSAVTYSKAKIASATFSGAASVSVDSITVPKQKVTVTAD